MKLKRDYSRGGCRECKRRKIKCDESKPHCLHCARLNKECSYPDAGEKVLRVSRRELSDGVRGTSSQKRFQFQVYQPKDRKPIKRRKDPIKGEGKLPGIDKVVSYLHKTPEDLLTKLLSLDSDLPVGTAISNTDTPVGMPITEDTPSQIHGELFDMFQLDDLDTLALDLNNIVADIISGPFLPARTFSLNPLPAPISDIPRHISFDYIKVQSGYEKLYLEDFYHGFAMKVMPFGAYDQIAQRYSNPIRDTILYYASHEPFLLAAVLAQGAKTAYDKNRLLHDHDEYKLYLSTSLSLLGPALARNRDKDVKNDLTSNIECILLTVLLLTSANATTKMQNWRPHLKGAKEIILKATSGKIRLLKTLILCKTWFIDFEVLAGSGLPQGGTLKTDEEIDSIINFSDYETQVLKEFGILQPNGFNVMFGYNNECMVLFRELIKIVNKSRDGTAMEDSLSYISLLGGFFEQYGVSYIERNIVLDKDFDLPGHLIDIIESPESVLKVSWMDLSQQLYCLAALVTIFTKVLGQPLESPHVQDLISKLVTLIGWLEKIPGIPRQSIEHSLSMVQWPMLIAATNCIDENMKYLLIKFFRVLVERGSGSAEIALEGILKVWGKEGGGIAEEVDVVPY